MKNRTLALCGIAAAFLLVLGGAALAQSEPGSTNQDGRLFLPDAASTYAKEIDDLWVGIFWITTVMFLLTEGLLVIFCVLYRRRPGHRPAYTHGNRKAEITWTIVPALMLLGIALIQIPTWNKIKKEFPDPKDPKEHVTEVRAFAQQYQWNIQYPGTKAFIEDDADASTVNLMHIPFGNKALVHLRSADVIHSMFIPHMRVKQDLVPGLRQMLWFEPNRIKLIDLKKKPEKHDGKRMDPGHEGEERIVQDFVWVNSAKDLEKGGLHKDAAIAVDGYLLDKDTGLYKPLKPKIRIMKDGAIFDGKWDDCTYCIGIFEIACAELCGLGHFKMRGQLVVEPKAAFDAWLKDQAGNKQENVWEKKLWRD